jgi:DNA-directed RNA polymerase specialized sigma24 family protein
MSEVAYAIQRRKLRQAGVSEREIESLLALCRVVSGRRKPVRRAELLPSDYAMSFEEIGKRLNISGDAASESCYRAIKKLRKHPESVLRLREMVIARQRLAEIREIA